MNRWLVPPAIRPHPNCSPILRLTHLVRLCFPALSLLWAWSSPAADPTGAAADTTVAVTNALSEKIWDQYAQVFARDLRGREGAATRAVAFAQVMTNHPPTALIRRARGLNHGRLQSIRVAEGSAGLGMPLVQVLRYVCALEPLFPQTRILVPEDLPVGRYDYIDTLPQGGRDVLRQALRQQFGLVTRREMRSNLVLTVKNPAAGLHPHTEAGGTKSEFNSQNVTLADVAKQLSKLTGVEVTDHTQLPGGYDFTLRMPPSPTTEELKLAILEQLGLQLSPAGDGQQVEFIIAEKAKP